VRLQPQRELFVASRPSFDQTTAQALQQAMNAARQGDPASAITIATKALSDGADPVPLNAFLGMMKARGGDLDAALPHLAEAHRLRPDDVTIALNYISALVDNGDHASALKVATEDLANRDTTRRIAKFRGFAAQTVEEFEIAARAYELVVAANPQDFETWNNLGNARMAIGDADGGVEALEKAHQLDPDAAPTRMNLSVAYRHAGRYEDAETTLRKMAEDFPGDARPWHEIYYNAKVDWDNLKALDALERAIAIDGESAGLHLKMAVEKGILNRAEESEASFERAIELDPTLHDAYIGLAIQYEHSNREHLFAPLIEQAEAHAIDEGALNFLRAYEHRRAGRFAEGLAAMEVVSPEIEPQRASHTRATLLDRLGRSDEAFAAFEETARVQWDSPTQPLVRAEKLRDELETEITTMSPQWYSGWCEVSASADHATPAFLVGFPRSGTTLLDTFLMGHPDTVVMEEQPPLSFIDREIGGIDALAALSGDALHAARDRYFEEVAKVCDWQPGKLLVDKSPLFLHKALLIHRLFPKAKTILALRHPSDVVLSCYMSNFRLNSAMANFLRLEDAAAFYDVTFRHWQASQAIAPLDVTRVHYEELVKDTQGVLRPLMAFLGLDWDDSALDHQTTARTRGLIKTASYSQVVEPIYNRAAGRWTRYRDHLAPILPTLRPWFEEFGYSE